jgi:hypothetical protein
VEGQRQGEESEAGREPTTSLMREGMCDVCWRHSCFARRDSSLPCLIDDINPKPQHYGFVRKRITNSAYMSNDIHNHYYNIWINRKKHTSL